MENVNIEVSVRMRPPSERETKEVHWQAEGRSVSQKGTPTSYSFDHVFTPEASNEVVYEAAAKKIVLSVLEGFHGTVFAYGQTASGKTHTMTGSEGNEGIIPLAMREVFNYIEKCHGREFLLRASYIEIYNEVVSDLLNPEKKSLKIHENAQKEVFLGDCTEEILVSAEAALDAIKLGERHRHFGETNMNEHSSRSHTIFTMVIESRQIGQSKGDLFDGAINVAKLHLVDLAGSERISQTGAEGVRLKEGANINRSLFHLSNVIHKLSEGQGHIPFRESKLTRILQTSLGGNARTAIICTITPTSIDETHGTLKFASRAKTIKNKPEVNRVMSDQALLSCYRKQINQLEKKLHEYKSESGIASLLSEKEQLAQELSDKAKMDKVHAKELEVKEAKIAHLQNFILHCENPTKFSSKRKRSKATLRRQTFCPSSLHKKEFLIWSEDSGEQEEQEEGKGRRSGEKKKERFLIDLSFSTGNGSGSEKLDSPSVRFGEEKSVFLGPEFCPSDQKSPQLEELQAQVAMLTQELQKKDDAWNEIMDNWKQEAVFYHSQSKAKFHEREQELLARLETLEFGGCQKTLGQEMAETELMDEKDAMQSTIDQLEKVKLDAETQLEREKEASRALKEELEKLKDEVTSQGSEKEAVLQEIDILKDIIEKQGVDFGRLVEEQMEKETESQKEVERCQRDLQQLLEELSEKMNEGEILQGRMAEKELMVQEAEKEIERLKEEISKNEENEKNFESANEELSAKSDEIKRIEAELEQSLSAKVKVEQEFEARCEHIKDLEESVFQLQEEVKATKKAMEEQHDEDMLHCSKQTSKIEKCYESVKDDLQEKESEIHSLEKKLEEIQAEMAEKEKTVQEAQQEIEALKKESSNREENEKNLESANDELSAKTSEIKRMEVELEKNLSAKLKAEQDLEVRDEEMKNLEVNVFRLQEEVKATRKAMKEQHDEDMLHCSKEISRMEKSYEPLQEELQGKGTEIHRLEKELEEIQRKLVEKELMAQEAQKKIIILEEEASKCEETETLQRNLESAIGEVSAKTDEIELLITKMREIWNAKLEAEQELNARLKETKDLRESVLLLEGEVKATKKAMEDQHDEDMLYCSKEVCRVEKCYEPVEDELQEKDMKIYHLEMELEKLKKNLESANQELSAKSGAEGLKINLEKTWREKVKAERELESALKEIEDLEGNVSRLQEEVKATKKAMEEQHDEDMLYCSKEVCRVEKCYEPVEDELQEKDMKIHHLETELEELKSGASQGDEKRRQIEGLKKESQELGARLQRYKKDRADREETLHHVSSELSAMTAENQKLRKELRKQDDGTGAGNSRTILSEAAAYKFKRQLVLVKNERDQQEQTVKELKQQLDSAKQDSARWKAKYNASTIFRAQVFQSTDGENVPP